MVKCSEVAMGNICSVLIPSRARVDKLAKCIESFVVAELDRTDFEILVRIDHDDPQLRDYEMLALGHPYIRLFVGPRFGFRRMSEYLEELSKASNAYWNLHFNDDATIAGSWLTQLERVPKEWHYAVCEWHNLGGSSYQYDFGGPFPFLPRCFWEFYGGTGMPEIADKQSILNLMEIGYNPWFLKGVSFHHIRDDNETLEAHRQMP